MPDKVIRKKCYYCGKQLSRKNKSNDHLIPKCRGGSNKPKNIVLACKKCNTDKNGLLPEEYRAVVDYRKGLVKGVTFKFWGELNRLL